MFVGLKRISAALGILTASVGVASAQGVAPSANQATAEAVATTLRSSASLSGYRIDVESRNGSVTLTGVVANQAQKAEAVARARSVSGVTSVSDQISVSGESRVNPVQYQVAMGGSGGISYGGGAPMASAPGIGYGGAIDGPMPEGPAGMPGASQASTPNYPNYAWPSYAPYPNYSAVGYPTVYPWQAWPNIGPPHPYPEVPLDWRAVTLRWDDGIWWLDFKKHYTRPFFTPYPFGLFAY
ncbi:MAG: BON domain-containing protein [Isosphaeraceae bacterium]